jgi:hypothetical protein
MGSHRIRIKYVGPGDLKTLTVPPPEAEIIQTSRAWAVGEELLPYRPGWYVQEPSAMVEATLTITVALTPPADY